MASTRLSYLSIIKEATIATAVQPDNFIRFKDGDAQFNQEVIENNPIQSNRHVGIQPVLGKVDTGGQYSLDLDYNECVFFLYGAMGTIASADISSLTDASVFRHTITTANSLPGFTMEQGKGNLTDTSNNRQNYSVERAFGVLVNTLTLSANDGIVGLALTTIAHGLFLKSDLVADAGAGSTVDLELESVEGLTTSDTVNIFDETPQSETDAVAAIDTSAKTIEIATLGNSYTIANNAKVELVPQTPVYSLDPNVAVFHHAAFQFGATIAAAGSADEENVEDWEFGINNNLEQRYGSLRATPSHIGEKGLQFTFNFKKFFENVTDRDRYLRQVRRAMIITLDSGVIVSATDTNDATYKVIIEVSDLRLTSYNLPTGTDDLYVVEFTAIPFYDTGDGRAVRIKVENENAGTVYTA